MFLKLVKAIFGVFASAYELLFKEVSDNYILLIAHDFDIIVSYDDREDEVSIDFDLSRYFKIKGYSQELQFPVLLNIASVSRNLGTSIPELTEDDDLNLEQRVKLKFKQFEIVWNHLHQTTDYKDVLSRMLMQQRIELKQSNELQNLESIIVKAHHLFKAHEFEKTIELLRPHTEKLSERDIKILAYSLKKMGQ